MRNNNACVSDPNSFITCAGSRYHVTYSPKILKNGVIKLFESGKEDIQEKINSFRDSCDMSFILNRLAMGDSSVLSNKTPMFGDFTDVPKNYADALQMVMDGEKEFMKLPLEVRNNFNNDFKQWFAQAGSDVWMEKMSSVFTKTVDEAKDEKEVVEDS